MKAPFALIVLAALAGCGSQESPAAKGDTVAEVLPGSASDAMLPYDTATSAPPLAPDQGWSGGSDEDAEKVPSVRPRGSATDSAPEPEAS